VGIGGTGAVGAGADVVVVPNLTRLPRRSVVGGGGGAVLVSAVVRGGEAVGESTVSTVPSDTSVGVLGVSTGGGGGVSGRLVSTASGGGCVGGLAVVSVSPPNVNRRLVKLLPRLSGRCVWARIP
jgi:hypothetical protein